jgi:hypothetical protein
MASAFFGDDTGIDGDLGSGELRVEVLLVPRKKIGKTLNANYNYALAA